MLGHRRLSILDLTNAASQPMIDPVRGDVALLNGEIYNYLDLRRRQEAQGQRLWSSGDTAVMLRHLSLSGFDAVRDLRGMFAIAVWDPRRRELLLARDALGIKPLYVARNPDPNGDWTLAFASEVRALLRSGLLRAPRLRASAVATVVWNGFTTAPETIIEGIDSFLPGEKRVFRQDGTELRRGRFWTQAELSQAGDAGEPELAAALEDSMRRHLAADVPRGIFLSGGVDSSVVANLAQRVSTTPTHTFTLAFNEQEHNEGGFARDIAQAIGTEHHEILLTQETFVDRLDEALASLDQPSFDGLNSFFISQAVVEAGFKVALVGSGGDELFGGYTSFRDLPKMAQASRRCAWLPPSLRMLAARSFATWKSPARGGFPPQTRWAKLPAMTQAADDPLALYQIAYGLFLPETHRALLNSTVAAAASPAGLPEAMVQSLDEEVRGRSDLTAIAALEMRLFLGERLLRDTDSISMAASLETRLPLVDQGLLETVARLPDDLRFQPVRSKRLLRKVGLAGLNPQLFDRPKSGFELPYDAWLRDALGQRVGAVLEDAEAIEAVGLSPSTVRDLWRAFAAGTPGLYWTRIWCIYALVIWTRVNGVSIQ